MKFKIYLTLIFGIFLAACTPKTTEVITTAPVEPAFDESNPCRKLEDLGSALREEAENSYVLYQDQMRFKRYEAARDIWKIAYELAPAANGKLTRQFSDGVTIYSELAKANSDTLMKLKYVDTIRMINAKLEECMGIDGSQMSRRAFDYYYNLGDLIPEEEQFETFVKAIELNKEKMVYFTVNPFTRLLFDRAVDRKISVEDGRKYAKIILSSIKYGKENCKGQECEGWDVVNDYAPDRLEALEGIDGFYDCAYYSDKYYALFKLYPDSCEIINMSYARLLRGACDANDPRLLEIKAAKDTKCFVAPPPPGTLKQAFEAYTDGKYKQAVELFDQFVSETDDNEKKAKYLILIAKIYYGDIKNFPQARKYALQAAQYKSGWGEPYLLIGKLYASSGPLCGPGRGFDSQIVTWPAIDMFAKARNVDASVAGEANALISRYAKYMPSKEDIFSRTLKAGSSYYVGCWIQENTTIRTAD